MANSATITKQLRTEGYPLELVHGRGYFYFIWDDGSHYQTESIYVYRFNHMSKDEWLNAGRDFGEMMKGTNMQTITLSGITYKAEPSKKNPLTVAGMAYGICSGCAFENDSVLCSRSAKLHPCSGVWQKDRKDIIWIKQK